MTIYDATKIKQNMSIWNSVNRTDPAHTKAVGFGRGFTAIDAHYQIMRATETFGAVGTGWGYEVVYHIQDKMLLAEVSIWHGSRSNTFGPICSIAPLYNKKDQLDDDAGKKAMTDALTKGLSHLGFSADVFLGKFDDNKYVQAVTSQIQQEEIKSIELPKNVKDFIEKANKLKTVEELKAHWETKDVLKMDDKVAVKTKGIIAELLNKIKNA
tara:strand:- start:811 stop:1446 length:636 start_codon:yes stop_codon:yes gene_type:complete